MRNGSQCLKGFMEFTERTHTHKQTQKLRISKADSIGAVMNSVLKG